MKLNLSFAREGNHDNGRDEFHYLAVIQLAFQQLAVIHLVSVATFRKEGAGERRGGHEVGNTARCKNMG